MNIFAPINSLRDAEAVTAAGADELYCGVIPTEWLGEYASVKPPNRRANERAQVGSLAELERVAAVCDDADVRLYVTLNAHFYSRRQRSMLEDLVDELGSWDGVTGYIVADVHLIRTIADRVGDDEILASTGATVFNGHAAAFLSDLGADGIHLPRHLTIDEIGTIADTAPDRLRLYAFVLNRNCLCIDGDCTLLHNPPIEHENAERIPCLQTFTERDVDAGSSREDTRLFPDPHRNPDRACGLCSLYAFREQGLAGVKMVGRGLPRAEKVEQVTLLDRVRERLETADSATEFAETVRPMVTSAGGTCDLDVCYYPTVMES